jgi:hypothetical protein
MFDLIEAAEHYPGSFRGAPERRCWRDDAAVSARIVDFHGVRFSSHEQPETPSGVHAHLPRRRTFTDSTSGD